MDSINRSNVPNIPTAESEASNKTESTEGKKFGLRRVSVAKIKEHFAQKFSKKSSEKPIGERQVSEDKPSASALATTKKTDPAAEEKRNEQINKMYDYAKEQRAELKGKAWLKQNGKALMKLLDNPDKKTVLQNVKVSVEIDGEKVQIIPKDENCKLSEADQQEIRAVIKQEMQHRIDDLKGVNKKTLEKNLKQNQEHLDRLLEDPALEDRRDESYDPENLYFTLGFTPKGEEEVIESKESDAPNLATEDIVTEEDELSEPTTQPSKRKFSTEDIRKSFSVSVGDE